jgi:ubiquinone/menaquinone biosynthesis C-methylase UbiE
MSYLSEDMLKRLEPPKGGKCLDLTCGTGFVTQKLSEITSGNVTGVDASEQMIAVAQKKYGDTCQFLLDDAYHFLKNQPSNSYDCITCAWGLGYLPPKILYEISRTLCHHGKTGIIDNSLLSNSEFVLFFLVALSEEPSALISYIKPQFYLSTGTLVQRMRTNGFTIIDSWKGEKVFRFDRKESAMEQLIKSGVAAGIIQLIDEDHKDKIIKRTGELLQRHHTSKEYIPVTHRYIGAVGEKK